MPNKLFIDLQSKKFSGYTYLVINGNYGYEESILIFSKGQVVGSIYLNDFYNMSLYGKKAFDLAINSFGNKDGLLNIYNLDIDQIKLLLIFNDKIKFDFKISKSTVSKLNIKYKEELTKQLLKTNLSEQKETKPYLFERYKLSELMRN